MNDGSTHWEGCWREHGHHACAIAAAELALAYVAALRQERDELRDEVRRLDQRNVDQASAQVESLRQVLRKIATGQAAVDSWDLAAKALADTEPD